MHGRPALWLLLQGELFPAAKLQQTLQGMTRTFHSSPCQACCPGAGSTARSWGIGSGQTAAQRASFEEHLRGLHASLERHGGPYLLGSQPSLADIVVYPFMKRFDVAAPLTRYDVSAALGGSIGRWLAAMDARPSCRTSAASSAALLQAYRQHRSLDFFDYETFGCFQLHPHNAALLNQP
jgi:glutathione S-transferase